MANTKNTQGMTLLQSAILAEIKIHNCDDEYLAQFNRNIKFLSMERYIKDGYDEYTICYNGDSMAKYLVKCSFKPAEKYGNNVVKYMVNIYSDGSVGIYFDGTEYKHNK